MRSSKTDSEELAAAINMEHSNNLSAAGVASGFLIVANTAICRPIRILIEQRGLRTSRVGFQERHRGGTGRI